MRRDALRLTSALLALGACESSTPTVGPTDAARDATAAQDIAADVPAEDVAPDVAALRPPSIARTVDDGALTARREACAFRAGAWPAETLGRDVPVGDAIPIDHVIVLMQENRSFDHYFSQLRAAGHADVEVPAADWSNPAPDGGVVRRHRDTAFCVEDPDHGWAGTHAQWNNGAMDGFVRSNEPDGARAMAYLDAQDLPFYYGLARTFSMADRYFCSVLGPTWPNRLYLMAGTSFGLTFNGLVARDTRATPVDNLFRRLDAAQVSWRNYAGGGRMVAFFPYYGLTRPETRTHFRDLNDLTADLARGDLPAVSFVEPSYVGNGGERVDEHPPGTPQAGEAFVERVVRGLMASPLWRRTALFITYDEHGGFADHVAPPPACAPDDLPPVNPRGERVEGDFARLGVRVPFVVVSPYARRGFVSHRNYDHTSIARFIAARFGLPAMTARDANATPPMDMFDFANPPFMTPPTLPSAAGVPAELRARCNAQFPSRI
jgi:phospholipase C